MPDTETSSSSDRSMDTVVTLPDQSAAPDVGSVPDHQPQLKNFAGRAKTVEQAQKWCYAFLERFRCQPERKSQEDKFDDADRMYRVSKTRDTSHEQYQPTLSNYPSLSYHRRINRLATETKNVLFSTDMPVRYRPIPGSSEYTKEEGERIAEERNLLLAYSASQDKAWRKIKDAILYCFKNSQVVTGTWWDYRTEKRKVRKVTERREADNKPAKIEWVEQDVTLANWPTFSVFDNEDVYFDALISEFQNQRCVVRRFRCGPEYAYQQQAMGYWMNVGKITAAHLYTGENDSDLKETRKDQADIDHTDTPTGELVGYDFMVMLPVNEKGDWRPRKQIPVRFWATFIGEQNSEPVCVRLIRNPDVYDEHPLDITYSHSDDIGAFHMGYVDILGANYEEESTTICQWEDNKTLRTKAPWDIVKGAYIGTDFTFGANKVFWRRPGFEKAEQIKVDDITQTMGAHLAWIERDGDNAVGTTKPVEAQTIGNRASATGEKQALEQGLKPLLEKADFIAEQLLVRYADRVRRLWDMYADPEMTVTIIHKGQVREIKPATLWGDMLIEVVSTKEYEAQVVSRAEQAQVANVLMPMWMQLGMKKPIIELSKRMLATRQYADVESWFDEGGVGEIDSERVARMENENILYGGDRQDLPKPGENHAIHHRQHAQAIGLYEMLPPDEQDPAALAFLKTHDALHLQAMQAAPGPGTVTGTANPQGGPQVEPNAGAPTPPQNAGEVSGDQMGAALGAREMNTGF